MRRVVRCSRTALAAVAVTALLVACGPDAENVLRGDAAAGQFDYHPVGHQFTWGFVELANLSDGPVTVLAVEPSVEGFTVLGVSVAGPDRPATAADQSPWPVDPDRFGGTVEPVGGNVLEPLTVSGVGSYELLIGLRVDAAIAELHGVTVIYRVNGEKHSQTLPYHFVNCSASAPAKECADAQART